MKVRLVTGGCGFIGSNFVRYMLKAYPKDTIVNLDLLTYAGKKENVYDIDESRYIFVHGDIRNQQLVEELFYQYDFDEVINFAAETHVDNSIAGPNVFIQTNVLGTHNLLNCALNVWQKRHPDFAETKRFLQISTDEVYGSLGDEGAFTETSPLSPSNPYSASKASADLLVQSYYKTFGLPVLITRCTNNYGPAQDAEKLIPLMISNALRNEKLPVYGDGKNVRDWIYVEDHCCAVDVVLSRGAIGEIYNIGAHNEWQNIDIVSLILEKLEKPSSLIEFVTDRLGHDRRYALDFSKLRHTLNWVPTVDFHEGLETTTAWYKRKYRA